MIEKKKRVLKGRINTVVLAKMKVLCVVACGGVKPQSWSYACGFLDGYAASRSLINPLPINQATQDAFMKWALK